MEKQTIAFIGAGNITRSLVAGLINNGFSADNIWTSDPNPPKLEFFHNTFSIHVTHDNTEAAAKADVIILAVKPKHLFQVCTQLREISLKKTPLIISVATGVTTVMLTKWLGNKLAIVRAMPNIPASVGAGATGLFANKQATDTQKDLAEEIFRAVGLALWVADEAQIDIVIAVSGSGPAYFFLVMEAMQESAQAMGLPEDVVRLLVSQTALGASKMAMEASQEVAELRAAVTSPNGTTECAIAVLEKGNIRKLFTQALAAAAQRSKELAQQLDQQ